MFTSCCVWPQIHPPSIISVSKRNPEVSYSSDFDPKHELLCDRRMTSQKYFLADDQTHWWFSFMRLWRIVFWTFLFLTLHIASEPFSWHITYWTVYSMSLCLCFTATCRLCIGPRGPSNTPFAWALESFALCVWGGVSRDAVAYRGSPLSLVLLLLTLHVSCHMSLNTFKHMQTVNAHSNTLYTYTNNHKTYTHLPAFPVSLCLWGNVNNNSVCNNASNANPHRSERSVSCGSAASYAHQSHNREIGIQAGCCVCLYVSATYSNVEPDAPMWASYRA